MTDDQLRALLPQSTAAAERSRVVTIGEIANQARRQGIAFDEHRAIAEGHTPEQVRGQVFENLINQQTSYTPPSAASMERHMSGNGRGGPDLGRYSLSRAIAAAAEGRLDGFEREMSDELARTMGRRPQGFFIPNEVLAERAGMSVTGDAGAYGANAVPTVNERLARGPAPAARRCRGRGNRSFWTCRQHRHSNRRRNCGIVDN